MRRTKFSFLAAFCLASASALGGTAWGQTVGTTGAVNPSATGSPPGGGERVLEIGSDVVFRERIRTTGSGSLQVLFVDTTTLSIGPNSDLLIDEFVYNPNAGTGSFAATLTRGSLRFVGGKISHTAGATINTPVATVGVRGGGAYIQLSEGECQKGARRDARTGTCQQIVAVCTVG
ncbi:MAG TPA: FecR domain-containing protein, partial [Propylenella sp.]|nr:FecR domain-containing protein [Propylenella sp.]